MIENIPKFKDTKAQHDNIVYSKSFCTLNKFIYRELKFIVSIKLFYVNIAGQSLYLTRRYTRLRFYNWLIFKR